MFETQLRSHIPENIIGVREAFLQFSSESIIGYDRINTDIAGYIRRHVTPCKGPVDGKRVSVVNKIIEACSSKAKRAVHRRMIVLQRTITRIAIIKAIGNSGAYGFTL